MKGFPTLFPLLIVSSRACLPLPLKVRTRREESDALIHDGLANPKVVFHPLLDTGCFGELVWFYTGPGRSVGDSCMLGGMARDMRCRCGRAEDGYGEYIREACGAADASEERGYCGAVSWSISRLCMWTYLIRHRMRSVLPFRARQYVSFVVAYRLRKSVG